MVATDGSEPVRKAVDTAIEIAKISEAKLYAVYVIASGGLSIAPILKMWDGKRPLSNTSGLKARKQRLMSKTPEKLQTLR